MAPQVVKLQGACGARFWRGSRLASRLRRRCSCSLSLENLELSRHVTYHSRKHTSQSHNHLSIQSLSHMPARRDHTASKCRPRYTQLVAPPHEDSASPFSTVLARAQTELVSTPWRRSSAQSCVSGPSPSHNILLCPEVALVPSRPCNEPLCCFSTIHPAHDSSPSLGLSLTLQRTKVSK